MLRRIKPGRVLVLGRVVLHIVGGRNRQNDVRRVLRIQGPRQSGRLVEIVLGIGGIVAFELDENGGHRGELLGVELDGPVVVIVTGNLLEDCLELGGNRRVEVRVGGPGIHNRPAPVDGALVDIKGNDALVGIRVGAHGALAVLSLPEHHAANVDAEKTPASRVESGRVDHRRVVEAIVDAPERHGPGLGSLAGDPWRPRETKSKLAFGSHLFGRKHLAPVGRPLVGHAHDAVGQLRLEEPRDDRLASKGHVKGQIGGVFRVEVVSLELGLFGDERGLVGPRDVALVDGLVGGPAAALGVGHGDGAGGSVADAPIHDALGSAGAGGLIKGRGLFLYKEPVDVVVGYPALPASAAGKGRDAAPGIDNDRLALRGAPHPQINVVGSVALEQSPDLHGFLTAAVPIVVIIESFWLLLVVVIEIVNVISVRQLSLSSPPLQFDVPGVELEVNDSRVVGRCGCGIEQSAQENG
mmetsp:Transcript_19649/g.45698  ORF Transcript_19649/g.45698 Transcript_19649/m.45698 type:complete len:468 (+) Transcript_19649:2540-3943(+)